MDHVSGVSDNADNVHSPEIPTEMNGHLTPLQTQVAGHGSSNGKSSGMLHHPDGYVLKPAEKIPQRENEIKFYQYISSASDPFGLELKEHVPKFYGTRWIRMNDKDVLFIVLQNVTDGMCEPCVMDVKIGKQTWEPSASEEKRMVEKAKYVVSKRECGFCIPGLQFYSITDCQLIKHGKEFGKTLDRNGIKDALKSFLNWNLSKSRPIILQFLCKLWKIQKLFQCQRQFCFYSSSLLFVYDAHFLRHFIFVQPLHHKVSEDIGESSTSQKPSLPGQEFKKHSFISNFEKELDVYNERYLQTLGDLKETTSCKKSVSSKRFADVKMIDFAHTLISPENEMDFNYSEGLNNLIEIFEDLLEETF